MTTSSDAFARRRTSKISCSSRKTWPLPGHANGSEIHLGRRWSKRRRYTTGNQGATPDVNGAADGGGADAATHSSRPSPHGHNDQRKKELFQDRKDKDEIQSDAGPQRLRFKVMCEENGEGVGNSTY